MIRCNAAVRFALCIIGCGPPVGVDESTGPLESSSAGPEPIAPAEWMSGLYSNREVNQDTATFTENGNVGYYEFLPDGTFLGLLTGGSEPVRMWAPISETEARIYPNEMDDPRIAWWRATEVATADGCRKVSLRLFVGAEDTPGPGLYRGKVCVVDVPCPPDQKPYEGCSGYRLVWCDEPPPGCDDRGCVCEDAGD